MEKVFINFSVKTETKSLMIFQFFPYELMTSDERSKIKIPGKNLNSFYILRIFILKGNKRIGWFKGEQVDAETFYMRNTGILPEHQGKKIYKNLLPKILEIVSKKGFQKISSRHTVTNTRIIIAKLKVGFNITGFDISDRFGVFVNLTYLFNDVRKKVIKYRVGEIRTDAQLKKLLKIK